MSGRRSPSNRARPRSSTAFTKPGRNRSPPRNENCPTRSAQPGQTLARMTAVDRNFSPAAFLDGAEKAFRIIVSAFAAGDRAALRPLLGEDTWNAFDTAITEREKAGNTHVTDVRAIQGISIEAADLKGTLASITARIVSDQVNMTHARSGQVITGTDAVTEINDLWTFERDLARPDPVWHLVAARSA